MSKLREFIRTCNSGERLFSDSRRICPVIWGTSEAPVRSEVRERPPGISGEERLGHVMELRAHTFGGSYRIHGAASLSQAPSLGMPVATFNGNTQSWPWPRPLGPWEREGGLGPANRPAF